MSEADLIEERRSKLAARRAALVGRGAVIPLGDGRFEVRTEAGSVVLPADAWLDVLNELCDQLGHLFQQRSVP